ncbi:FimV/HubP family polar landmark protein [Curvibacter delicatus]|uniref:FimV/HubP family polar landmark protein n=1 Tax=Curvibacter delicatus TaxID=80879 RepID=UPI000A49810D
MIAKSHRWQKTALAAAAAAVLGLWGTHASALSLGRIAVLSALGEPLRAEIDIPDINAEEAASLKASVASPEAFRAAGMDYNASMSGLQITLQKRPDGRSFLRVSSDRTINDPYIDLILEASWSSGRIVRDYTMLFDPPNLRQPQAVTATVPQVSPAPSRAATPAARTTAPAPASDTGRTVAPAAARQPARAPAEPTAKVAPDSSAKQLTVKSGDTASKLAAANRPAGVSLDQMLVAMLRANPDAFIGGNINRLRSGAVVDMPGAEDAQATPADEARQIVLAQSKDFNEFRRKLAGNAPVSQVTSADRRASGKVEAQVEDKKSAAGTPDKLTLSKGAVQAKGGEEKIAQERSAKEAASRAEELSKNIAELSKLSAAAAPAPAASAPQAAAPAPAASEPAAAASAAAPAVTASAPATEASAPAPAPVASAPVKRPVPPVPMPVEEPSLLDELLDNPLVPAAAAGLLALLAGLGIYRVRQRKQAAQMDSSFLESRLQPDSFFGASGGQRVDTHDSGANGSSMVYSPSQLEAADDVDPVAEADVYLAYGRDLQAEEILKEALRVHPDRVAIHLKLLEIYAKRRDVRNFESSAAEAHRLTGGEGADWNRVCELGLGIDPGNSLFQPGGQPAASAPTLPAAVSEPVASAPEASPQVATPAAEPAASALDLDLDLDFSLDEEPATATPAVTATPAAAPAPESVAPDLDLNFELPTASIQGADNSLEFEPPSLPEPSTGRDSTAETAGSTPTAAADTGALEFDLGSLSLDLGEATTEQTGATDDPLATKLALAEEFSAIGDTDGARALIEEIIAEATGDMKIKAQEALSKLN